MANREKTDRKTGGTSLLWQPPKSSDTLGSVLLMPVLSSQTSSTGNPDGTSSSFLGQKTVEDAASKVSEANNFNLPFASASTAELPVSASSSKSQLNQPLRVRQSSPSPMQSFVPSSTPGDASQPQGRIPHRNSTMAAHYATASASSAQQTVPSASPSPIVPSFETSNETISATVSGPFSTVMTSTNQKPDTGYPNEVSLPFVPQTVVSTQSITLPPYGESYYQSECLNQTVYQGPLNSGSTVYGSKQQSIPYSTTSPVAGEFIYIPVEAHWFYRKVIERRDVWFPFSKIDSLNLEDAFRQNSDNAVVATDGGRYDVFVKERVKKAVYWKEDPLNVRRCTWFYKSDGPQRYFPYEEELASKLEEYFHMCSGSGKWGQRLELSGSEIVVMQSPQVMIHYIPSNQADDWTSVVDYKFKQRVVKRGLDEMMLIEDGESLKVDHLVFVVQGIGSVCDLRFRTVAECVDGFREIANNLVKTHFKSAVDSGRIGRIEFLPVSWHSALHTDDTGVDGRMKCITLPSIPKLRHFTNDTLLDILYYTSPVYCQTILDSVGDQLNELFQHFLSRNPQFTGRVSVAGHSLGSLILFDILANHNSQGKDEIMDIGSAQDSSELNECADDADDTVISEPSETTTNTDDSRPAITSLLEKLNLLEYEDKFIEEKIDLDVMKTLEEEDIKNLGLPMGPRKKLMAHIRLLNNNSKERITTTTETENADNVELENNASTITRNFVSREDSVSTPFSTQTVTSQYPMSLKKSIYSPIKYPRLDFSPACFFALGSPISMFLTIRGFNSISEDYRLPTCSSFFNIFHPYDPVAFRIETLIDQNFTAKPVVIPHHKGRKRLHLELKEGLSRMGYDLKQKLMESLKYTWNSISEFAKAHTFPTATVEAEVDKIVQEQMSDAYESDSTVSATDACREEDIQIGQLNGGRRIDFVLQEKPIESLNEYLFALTSHATYWDSEDTVLMILREVYALENIFPSSPYKDSGKLHLYNPSLAPLSSSLFQLAQPPASSVPTIPSISSFQQPSSLVSSSQQLPSVTPQVPSPPQVPSTSSLPQMNPKPPSAPSQPIGPPPLTGFVKRSALSKH